MVRCSVSERSAQLLTARSALTVDGTRAGRGRAMRAKDTACFVRAAAPTTYGLAPASVDGGAGSRMRGRVTDADRGLWPEVASLTGSNTTATAFTTR